MTKKIAQKTLDDLSGSLSNLDSFFAKPQSIDSRRDEYEEKDDFEEKGERSHGEIQASVNDVYSHLEKLRSQLKTIS